MRTWQTCRRHQGERLAGAPAKPAARRRSGEGQHENRQHSVEAEPLPKFDPDDEPRTLWKAEPSTHRRCGSHLRQWIAHSATVPRRVSSTRRNAACSAVCDSIGEPSSAKIVLRRGACGCCTTHAIHPCVQHLRRMRRVEPVDEEWKCEAQAIELRRNPLPAQIDSLWGTTTVSSLHRILPAASARDRRQIGQAPRASLTVGHDLRLACSTSDAAPLVIVGARGAGGRQDFEVGATSDPYQGIVCQAARMHAAETGATPVSDSNRRERASRPGQAQMM
jgi:hypothetical protein